MASQAGAEFTATVDQVNQVLAGLDSKIEGSQQPSPGSAKGSQASTDSGVSDERPPVSKKTSLPNGAANGGAGAAPISAERKTSRRSASGNIVSPVLEQLEQLIISDEWINKMDSPFAGSTHQALVKTRSRAEGPRLSDLGRTLVTSASLKAYIDLLGTHHRQSIASWLFGNTSATLAQLFRFPESLVHCSENDSSVSTSLKNGIGHAVRLALRDTYGAEYTSKGWRTFVEQGAPVVYVSPALHLEMTSYLTAEFGIADVVPLSKLEGELSEIEGRIDHAAFDKQLDADVAAGKRPLLVIAVVGSTVLGQNDMVSKLLDIRKTKHRFWLHIVGQAVAALTLREPTQVLVHVLSQVDSMSLPLALWLGIPAAPLLTLHRAVEGFKPTYREKLDSLPWWVATQHLTTKRITDMIEHAYFLSKVMLKGLSTLREVEITGIENAVEFANKVYKNQYLAPTVLIFKYRYEALKELNQKIKFLSKLEGKEREKHATELDGLDNLKKELEHEIEYADSLNSWLGQGLISECRQLGLHLIELGGIHGTAFRFCPLESAAANATHHDHVQKLIVQLADTLKIVESTVAARRQLPDLVAGFPSLVILPVQKWAGAGAVCFVPSIVKETDPSEWNDTQRQQVSHLNLELVHALRAVDTAFSAGESQIIGVHCVKFGMLSDEKDLVDLVNMVADKGKEIESSQQYLDSLAELIRQGIEAANEDLKKENDARLMQEGVIRQLPLMGSLVNWFSPLDKETTNIKGRSFNLKTGEISSTEKLYYRHRSDDSAPQTPVSPVATSQMPHVVQPTVSAINEEDEGEKKADEAKLLSDTPIVEPPKTSTETIVNN